MNKKWRRLALLLILVLLILVAARDLVITSSRNHTEQRKKDTTPDWFITGAHGFTTDENGQLKSQLHSPTLQHYASGNVIHLNKPHFIVYDKKHIPWDITALTGQYYQTTPEYLHLVGHVVVKQLPAPGSQLTEIHTSILNYYPKTNLATTDQAVRIKQAHSLMQGVGMIANLKTSQIKFLSQSHGEYEEVKKSGNSS